jgi:NADH-ubiquinone oxidoreductase chain 6
MSLWIICNILFTLSLSILLAPSPFTIGLTILVISLLVATVYASILSSWFAFLIYLIYVGGILVIFSYFLALTPNQSSISRPFIPIFLVTLFIILFSSYSIDIWSVSSSYIPQTSILFEFSNSSLLITLLLILLLTIIIVVKISTRGQGPLRAFISYVQTYPNYTSSN